MYEVYIRYHGHVYGQNFLKSTKCTYVTHCFRGADGFWTCFDGEHEETAEILCDLAFID